MILTEMPDAISIFARKYEILPPPTSMAELMRSFGTPICSKNWVCSRGGMMTVMSSPRWRMKSPLGI